jgi:hypothetical protein
MWNVECGMCAGIQVNYASVGSHLQLLAHAVHWCGRKSVAPRPRLGNSGLLHTEHV